MIGNWLRVDASQSQRENLENNEQLRNGHLTKTGASSYDTLRSKMHTLRSCTEVQVNRFCCASAELRHSAGPIAQNGKSDVMPM